MAKVNIGNYTSIADILKVLTENKVKPEDAFLEVEAYTLEDSYGGEYTTIDVLLRIPDKN
jgi:hypothetical protein